MCVFVSYLLIGACSKPSKNNDNETLFLALALASTSQSAVVSCNNDCRIFITATKYNGNLGGITGADEKCSKDSNKPTNRNSIYKALIWSNGTRSAIGHPDPANGGTVTLTNWVIKQNTKYVKTDGSAFTTSTSKSTFFEGNASQVQKALGNLNEVYWTGVRIVTNELSNEPTQCNQWTSASSSIDGSTDSVYNPGVPTTTFSNQNAFENCGNLYSLVCVEQ